MRQYRHSLQESANSFGKRNVGAPGIVKKLRALALRQAQKAAEKLSTSLLAESSTLQRATFTSEICDPEGYPISDTQVCNAEFVQIVPKIRFEMGSPACCVCMAVRWDSNWLRPFFGEARNKIDLCFLNLLFAHAEVQFMLVNQGF
jgi:hypothetical protein